MLLVGLSHLQLSQTPASPWLTAVPEMSDSVEEFSFKLQYRGRNIQITFVPDEKGTSPGDANLIKVSDEQAKGWDVGEWWYHDLLVSILDDQGETLELQNQATSFGFGRLPSFMDHNELIQAICDGLCNELDDAGIPKGQPAL